MTADKMNEAERLISQALPTLRVEKRDRYLYIYPNTPTSFSGTIMNALIHIFCLLNLGYLVTVSVGEGIRIEAF